MDACQDPCWSEARNLLRQIADREETQISQQQRTSLYRMALALLAMGVWVDRYGLPQCPATDRDWVM